MASAFAAWTARHKCPYWRRLPATSVSQISVSIAPLRSSSSPVRRRSAFLVMVLANNPSG
jgi:hypothetical protein